MHEQVQCSAGRAQMQQHEMQQCPSTAYSGSDLGKEEMPAGAMQH